MRREGLNTDAKLGTMRERKGRQNVLSFHFSGTDFFPVKIATRLLKRR